MSAIGPFHVVAALVALIGATMPLRAAKPQTSPAPAATLVVSGDVARPLSLSMADLKAMPRTTIVTSSQGRDVKYEGVLVAEVLRRAGVPLGSDLTGPTLLAAYVLATAADGYQVVFSLAELDPATTGSEIMIADAADGQPMAMPQGPFKVVCPHDKRTARAIRMLTKLEIVRLHK